MSSAVLRAALDNTYAEIEDISVAPPPAEITTPAQQLVLGGHFGPAASSTPVRSRSNSPPIQSAQADGRWLPGGDRDALLLTPPRTWTSRVLTPSRPPPTPSTSTSRAVVGRPGHNNETPTGHHHHRQRPLIGIEEPGDEVVDDPGYLHIRGQDEDDEEVH